MPTEGARETPSKRDVHYVEMKFKIGIRQRLSGFFFIPLGCLLIGLVASGWASPLASVDAKALLGP